MHVGISQLCGDTIAFAGEIAKWLREMATETHII
jgi:hypothetical protein